MATRKGRWGIGGKKQRLGRSGLPKRLSPGLGIEALEQRTLLAVTPSLSNGVLAIALDAPADVATISIAGGNIDVFDGASHTQFATGLVQAINAFGNNMAGQTVALSSDVHLTKQLQATALTMLNVTGNYQVGAVDVQAGTVNVSGMLSTRAVAPGADPLFASSTGPSGDMLIRGQKVNLNPGSGLLANADGGFTPGTVIVRAGDSQSGEDVDAAAAVVVNGAIVRGGDVFIQADAFASSTASKPLDSFGASIATIDSTVAATVDISGTPRSPTEITAAGTLSVGARATAVAHADAVAQSNDSDTGKDAAFALNQVHSTAHARVGDFSHLAAGAALLINAANSVDVATKADGSSSGSNAGGASVAIADVTALTEAFVEGSALLNGLQVHIGADADVISDTDAISTSLGTTQNTQATQNTLQQQNANTGDGPVTLAAAVGVTNLHNDTRASVASSQAITAAQDVSVDARGRTRSSVDADGSAGSQAGNSSGAGIGVAIDHAKATTKALIGGTAPVRGAGIAVTSMNLNGADSLEAHATSGPAGSGNSFKGAFAFEVGSSTHEAVIAAGAQVDAGAFDLRVIAVGDAISNATAGPSTGNGGQGSGTTGFGAGIAFNLFDHNVRAELEDGASVQHARNVAVASSARTQMNTEGHVGADPAADGSGATGFAAAGAISVFNTQAKARVGLGDLTTIGGGLTVNAYQASSVHSTADDTSGGDAAKGAAVALNVVSAKTIATLERSVDADGDVALTADSVIDTQALASASAHGGTSDSSAPAGGVDGAVGNQLGAADSQAASGGTQGTNGAKSPSASNSDGGMSVAGALAINIVTASEAQALITPRLLVKTDGNVSLSATNDTDAVASADGSLTAPDSDGVGVAIAINAAPDIVARAAVQDLTQVEAKGLSVHAGMFASGDGKHHIAADAISGAGAKETGIGGALAINIAKVTTEASLDANTSSTLTGGLLSVQAIDSLDAASSATPHKDGASGKDLGVGASFAFNIVEHATRAEVTDTAQVSGPNGIAIKAQSGDSLTTTAETGVKSTTGSAYAASVAASALSSSTNARLGGGNGVVAPGDVTVTAVHTDHEKTSAGGEGKGAEKAIGVSIAFDYRSVETNARLERDLTQAGAVTVSASASTSAETTAKASETGGKDGSGQPANGAQKQGEDQKKAVDSKASDAGVQGTAQGTKVPDAKNADNGSLTAAGAIALELPVKVHTDASIPAGRTIEASGALTVHAASDVDAKALADGTAVGQATTGVGVAVAVAVAPDVETKATIGSDNSITAQGVTVNAGMSSDNDGTHVLKAEAISGASAADKAGSGAFALDVFFPKTEAAIGGASQVHAKSGDVSVTADEKTTSDVNAVPAMSNGGPGGGGSSGGKVLGVGVAVALNIVETQTNAIIAEATSVADAHDVTVAAHSNDQLKTKATAGGAASSQDDDSTGVGAEAALTILIAKTNAALAAGGTVGASGNVNVATTHVDTVTTTGDGAGSGADTAAGIAIGFGYVEDRTAAIVDKDVSAGGGISVLADNASASSVSSYASAKGGKDKKDGGDKKGVDSTGQKHRDLADDYAMQNGGQATDVNTKNPQAKTAEDSIAVAGALAINIVAASKADATIVGGHSVHADGGPLSVTALNDTDANAVASGSATGQATTGVGVAVAINVAPEVNANATVGTNADVRGKGITIEAGRSLANGTPPSLVGANAVSGASASKKAGAGALGLSLVFEKAEAVAQTGAHLDALGGPVMIKAASDTTSNAAATPTKGAGGTTLGVGVSVAVSGLETHTRAELEDNATLLSAGSLTLGATSHTTSTAKAEAGADAPEGDAGAGAAAISVKIDHTTAKVAAGDTVITPGAVDIEAVHTGNSLAQVDADAKGANTVVGIGIGINYDEAWTTAGLHRSILGGGGFTVAATNDTTADANAKASATSAKGQQQGQGSDGVDKQAASQRDYANDQISSSGGQGANTSQNTQAKTSEDGVSVAGALGLNISLAHADASIDDNLAIKAGGLLAIRARNDADATASADGTASGISKTGVGAAVAINYVEATSTARLGKDAVRAHGVTIEATQGPGAQSEDYSATAVSGAGAKNIGVAGAVALNLVIDSTHSATIASGATINATGGDVNVIATSATNDTASATPTDGGADAGKTGVGVSVAANVLLKKVHAEIEDGAQLTNVGALSVTAGSADVLNTIAKNGAQGETSVGVGAGVMYVKNDTLASVGTGDPLTTTGSVKIDSLVDDHATTTIDASNLGAETVVGLSIGVNVMRATSDAELKRSIDAGGGISLTAEGFTTSAVEATASAAGVPKQVLGAKQKNSDQRGDDQFGFLNSMSGENESSSDSSLLSILTSANSTTQSNSNQQSKDSVGVAAAIAVNVEHVDITASVDPHLNLKAAGPVVVATTSEIDGSASALGLALQIQQGDSTTVAAAVAVNVALAHDNAHVGLGTSIEGTDITLASNQAGGTTNDLTARAISGSGGTGDAGAGSASVIVARLANHAIADTDVKLTSGGNIDVSASNHVLLQNLAGGGAIGKGNGGGIAIAVTDVDEHTTEALVKSGGVLQASGETNITANASLLPITGQIPGDPTSGAVGVAATTDTNVGGSLVIDVVNQKTQAVVESNVSINESLMGALTQHVHVSATGALTMRDAAGGVGISGGSGVGVGLVIGVANVDTIASIGDHATVRAGGDVTVNATEDDVLFGLGVAGGFASDKAVTVTAVIFVPHINTIASIGSQDVVTANGNVIVGAAHSLVSEQYGGALSVGGGNASFGAEFVSLILNETTDAGIGSQTLVIGHGRTAPLAVPTEVLDANGKFATKPVSGIAITAVDSQDVTTISVGGAVSDGAGVSGSAVVNVLNISTKAHVERDSVLNASDLKPGTGPSAVLLAASITDLTSAAGAIAGGSNAGVGIGADVGVITKDTQSQMAGAGVRADGDLSVKALSSESIVSVSASLAASGSFSAAGAAGVYVIDVTTRAFIGTDPRDPEAVPTAHVVQAGGNVQVAARESLDLFLLSGTVAASGTGAVGAGAGIPIITKTTEGFIGADTDVTAKAQGGTIDADTGLFGVSYDAYSDPLQAKTLGNQKDTQLTKNPNDKLPSQRLTDKRTATPQTKTMKGVAVTATNRDDVQLIGASAGASGSVAVNVSGAIHVLSNTTTAHVDQGSTINKGVVGVADAQSIQIAAGNDLSYLGVAAGLSVAGTAAVTAGATVLVVDQSTKAWADDNTFLSARKDITVEAHGVEDLLTVAATVAGSGGASVGGAVSVIVINNHTYAHIGDVAENAGEGAVAQAPGNIIVSAIDDTGTLTVAGGVTVGLGAGIGGSVGVIVYNKDTQAYVGDFATIDAGGNLNSASGIIDGTMTPDGQFNTFGSFRGLAVQAASSEDIFQVAAAASFGLYFGLGGGVSIEVYQANTVAHVGKSAQINEAGLPTGANQRVSVAAVDRVKDFSLAGGVGGGVVGIGGGVDVGIVRNNTSAFVDEYAVVDANAGIDVSALSFTDLESYAISGSGGLGAFAGSVAVWSIGAKFESSYKDENQSANAIDPSELQKSTSGSDGMGAAFKNATQDYLSPGNNGAMAPAKNTGDVKTKSDGAINAKAQGGQAQGAVDASNVEAGTTAAVRTGVTLTTRGNLGVHAVDKLKLNLNVGGVAVGFVSVGAAIAVVNVQTHVGAEIGNNVSIKAKGDVTINAIQTNEIHAFVMAAKGGVGALGAEVAVIHDQSTQSAAVGNQTKIEQAGNIVVFAGAGRTIHGETLDVGAGGVAIGVTVVDLALTGSTKATVGDGVKIGISAARAAGSLSVIASANNTIEGKGLGFSVGVGAASVNVSSSTITPEITAGIGNVTTIFVSGSIGVGALSLANGQADLLNSTNGGIAATAMVAHVDVSPALTASVGILSSLNAGQSISFLAFHNSTPDAPIDGLGASAHASAPGDAAVSGTGVSITADANSTALAQVPFGTLLNAKGEVKVQSAVSNQAKAEADSASVSVLGVGVANSTANANGSSKALMNGYVLQASKATIKAASFNDADADATSVGLAFAGAAVGATSTANASPTVEARAGNGAQGAYINATKGVEIRALSDGNADADGHTLSVSGLFSLGLVNTTANLNPDIDATVGAKTIINGGTGAITVAAEHNLSGIGSASATADAPGGGFLSGTGASAGATASPIVSAFVGQQAQLSTRGNIDVLSTAVNSANATAQAISLGGAAIGSSSATSTTSGDISATLLGNVPQAGNLSVIATGTNAAIANADATSGALLASGAGATSTATSSPVITASIGANGVKKGPLIDVNGNVTLGAESFSTTEAHGHTAAIGGLIGLGIVSANATTTPNTNANVGPFTGVKSGKSINIYARHNNDQRMGAHATAQAPGGGFISGNGALPDATTTAQTKVNIANRVSLGAKDETSIGASASGIVLAEAQTESLGFAALGTSLVNATSDGTTKVQMNGEAGGRIVSVTAHSVDSADAEGTSAVKAIASGNGVISKATLSAKTIAQVGDEGVGGAIKAKEQATLAATAEETSKAQANAQSFGALFSLGLSEADATMTSEVTALLYKGTSMISTEGGAAINASLTLPHIGQSAEAHAQSPGGGLVAINGAAANANATPTVTAKADTRTRINAKTDISVKADSTTQSDATSSAVSLGALSAGGTLVNSLASANTSAALLGKVETGGTLTVQATGNNNATANGEAASRGLISGAGTFVNATVQPTTKATLGTAGDTDSSYALRGDVTVSAHDRSRASATAGASALGIAGLGIADATATVAPIVDAAVSQSSRVTTLTGGLLVNATSDGAPSAATARATGDGALGGIQSTKAKITLSPIVAAHVDSKAYVNLGGVATITANANNQASSLADGQSLAGGVGAGGSSAHTETGGATLAFTLDVDRLSARAGILVQANDTTNATSHAVALGGGVLAGVAGSDASTNVSRLVLATLDSNGGPVLTGGDVDVAAVADESSSSTADGTSVGGISVGVSHAKSSGNTTVRAIVGNDTKITASGNVNVHASGASDVIANANTSAAGAAGVEGTLAERIGTLDTQANIAARANIGAKSIGVLADTDNRAHGSANGAVGGLFGGGSQIGKADLYTTTVAEVSNSTAQKPTKLNASENITVQATGFTGGHTNTEGGAGGLIGAGGAEDYFYIHTPLVRASIGDNGGVTATKDVSVLASDTIKSDAPFNGPMASAHQSAAGGVAIVEVVSQARVYGGTPYICPCEPEPIQGEVLIAEVGQNATIKGKTFQAKAWQQDVSVKSSAEAYAVGAGASAKANSTADAYTGSIVRIRKGAKITTTGKLDLTATGPNNIFTTSSATAHADGFPGAFAGATAASDKHSHDCVIAELGASLTAGQFTHHAGASPAINNNYGYNKITDAVIDLIIDGFESTPGTQTNDACEDIKATVKIV